MRVFLNKACEEVLLLQCTADWKKLEVAAIGNSTVDQGAIQVLWVTCIQTHLIWHPGLEVFHDNKYSDCIHHFSFSHELL